MHGGFDVGKNSGYGLAMIKAADDNDEYDDDEDYGPSLAYPPLYVLRTADYCPKCHQVLRVYTLGCSAFRDAEDGGDPIEQFHFLRYIRSVPEPVLAMLRARLPGYYLDQPDSGGQPYLMNHCPCGAKLDDERLHGDVGVAFWPDTPNGFAALRLFRLPVTEPIPVECSLMIGGGDYLNIAQAEAW
jgi:hypothetical protein